MERLASLVIALLAFAAATTVSAADPTSASDLIRAAGNTSDEGERHRLLRTLEARAALDATLRAELGRLLPLVDEWANGKTHATTDDSRPAENGYLCKALPDPIPLKIQSPISMIWLAGKRPSDPEIEPANGSPVKP